MMCQRFTFQKKKGEVYFGLLVELYSAVLLEIQKEKREAPSCTKICDKVGQRRRLFEPEQFELGLIVLLSKRQLKSQIAN